jgi:hypothetical protein
VHSDGPPPIAAGSPEQDGTTGWIDNYVASYRYQYAWAAAIIPMIGLLGFFLARQSELALAVAIGTEVLFILVSVEWKTYCVQINAGSISRSSALHSKAFPLSEVDLIQHLYGDRGGQLLRIRHSDRILITASSDLDGFDDLVGFFREYARHHHLIFATRDDWGEWTQAKTDSHAGTDT